MCVESLKRKDIFAPFLLVYYYYYLFISDTSGKHKQHEARSIVNNKQTHKKIGINNGQQYSLASLGYADMVDKSCDSAGTRGKYLCQSGLWPGQK